MRVHKVNPRKDFNKFIEEEVGYFHYDTINENYIESNYIAEISEDQADFLDAAAVEVYDMCLSAVDKIVKENRFAEFGVGALQAKHITASWNRPSSWPDGSTRDPQIYARIDFAWDGKDSLKFYEINADTPSTVYECAVVQKIIAEDLKARGEISQDMSQFNLLQEKTVERLSHIFNMASEKITDELHFTTPTEGRSYVLTTRYLEALAQDAGWYTKFVDIDHIGAEENSKHPDYGNLYDADDIKIQALYKFMPWEHLYESDYAKHIARDEIMFLEPAWTALLSNKMMSVVLWEMYPDHPYLLPTYQTPDSFDGNYVEKPIFGRMGSDIKVIQDNVVVEENYNLTSDPDETKGDYSDYKKIYQKIHPLPEISELPGWRFQTGVWVVGDKEVAGMEIRIDKGLISGSDNAKFLPHVMSLKMNKKTLSM